MHVWIEGNVQGVFFRANTRDKAVSLEITGWVKNLSDGRVEAVFEGEDEAIKEILEFCREAPFGAKVDDMEIKEEPYKGEFESFEVTY